MLRQKRQRFERLLRLRQREVDNKQALLAQASSLLRETRLALEQAQTELRNAAHAYRVPDGQVRSAEAYFEAGAWLKDRVRLVERALNAQDKAKEKVRLAGIALQVAEKAKRQIETLVERIREEERVAQNRHEQIEQDEIATRLTSYDGPLGH